MPITATDDFSQQVSGLNSPYKHAALVSPSDTDDLTKATRGLYIGGAGTLKVTTVGGETLTLTGLLANTQLPLRVTKVFSTGTTATNIAAFW